MKTNPAHKIEIAILSACRREDKTAQQIAGLVNLDRVLVHNWVTDLGDRGMVQTVWRDESGEPVVPGYRITPQGEVYLGELQSTVRLLTLH
jgi:DNA-binding PadR family transcriptional regulator